MLSQNSELTKQDFEQCLWQKVIEESENKQCSTYSDNFFSKLHEAKENNNLKEQEMYALLASITSLYLDLDSREQPFKPKVVLQNSRSAALDDINDYYLDLLKELVPDIVDAEMRARVADILWVRKREHKMAAIAVESYIESFKTLLIPDNWPPCVERIERALQLAALLGRKNKPFLNTIEAIEETLDKYNGEDPLFLSARLMKLLQEQRVGDPVKYAALSEKMAQRAEDQHDWNRARNYWECSATWHSMNKDPESKRESLISRAETYVKQSESALSNSSPSYISAASYLEKAIEALRRIEKTNERVAELHKILLEYQEKSSEEMDEISSGPIDITKLVTDAQNKVKGKSLTDAIITLAKMGSSPKISDLKRRVEESAGKYVFQHLFSAVAVNETGKVIARQPSMLSDTPEEVEAAKKVEMYKEAVYHQHLHTLGIIDPARQQILLEHDVREHDFLSLVSDNMFIPPGREEIYARGLYAGLKGDFMVSTHLLIPQLEHSIRHILYQNGVIVSTLDSDGIQDERNLNSLLFLPELSLILGEDLTFDLQGLLVERFGSNLRNRMAHGLIDTNAFHSTPAQYLWWIMLKLCLVYKIATLRHQQITEAETETSNEE